MMIEYKWLIEGQVVIFSGDGEITPEDIVKENNILNDFLANGTGDLVHVIGDDRNLEDFPSLEVLMSTVEWIQHENLGYFIIVGMDDVIHRMQSSMVTSKQKIRFRLATTMEEALDHLELVDATLPRPLQDHVPDDIMSGKHLERYTVVEG